MQRSALAKNYTTAQLLQHRQCAGLKSTKNLVAARSDPAFEFEESGQIRIIDRLSMNTSINVFQQVGLELGIKNFHVLLQNTCTSREKLLRCNA